MRSETTKFRIRCAKKLEGLVLDLGAGEGSYVGYLPGKVVSVDIHYENLRRLPGAKVVGDATNLPFHDDVFDGVWACAILEHVETNFIPEMIRIVKPGGVIYVLTPNRHSPYDPIKRLFGLGDWWSNQGHVRLYSMRELKSYGRVWGEVWWVPGLDLIARYLPQLGHTLMLRIAVTLEEKVRCSRQRLRTETRPE